MAIVGILASVAYPSYQNHVTKTHRVNAEGSLLELSQYMEKFYTETTGGYDSNPFSLPFSQSPNDGSAAKYNITVTRATNSYTLTATPTSAQNDPNCGALTLNSVGVKCINGSTTQCSNSTTQSVIKQVNSCW